MSTDQLIKAICINDVKTVEYLVNDVSIDVNNPDSV